MTSRSLVRLGVLVVALPWAHSCGRGAASPTAPTVAAPAGCSGSAIERVTVNFGGQGETTGVAIQLFGKAISQQIAPGQTLAVIEDIVPCDYEITGQMLGRALSAGFTRTPPFRDSSSNVGKGVEKGSIVVDEGPNPVFGPASQSCHVNFKQNSTVLPPPYNFKIRFRVSNSNAVDGTTGGCS